MNAAGLERTRGSRDAIRAFWTLTVVALLAMGTLSAALTAAPSPSTGLLVAVAGVVLIVALALAARVLLAVERAREKPGLPADRR